MPACISALILRSMNGKPDTAFLHISVNHAVSDAACVVAMVSDLIELTRTGRSLLEAPDSKVTAGDNHAAIEGLARASILASGLLPAPNGIRIMQDRLKETLFGAVWRPASAPKPPPDAAPALDVVHNSLNCRRTGYDYYVRLLPGACRVMSFAAKTVGVPVDHLIVSVIGLASARVLDSEVVKFSLIAPMRDGRNEAHAVGNVASTRHLDVFVGAPKSVAACVLDISSRLRRRDWSLCDVLNDDGDRVLINVRSLPEFVGASTEIERVDTTRNPSKAVRNVIEMFVDQETAEQWTLWIGLRHDLSGRLLSRTMRQAIWSLATSPLLPLPLE